MKTVIKVEGMSCNGCRMGVTKALLRLPGVKSAEVSLEKKEAAVEHEASVSPAALKAAVDQAGFKAC